MPFRAVLATVGCAALVAGGAMPAEAASPIQLGKIQYNSPGTDRATNASVNGEYVVIKNTSRTALSLKGWTVRDAKNHVYKFGTFTLGAGKSVVLHSGKGANTQATRYWGSGSHIWNNTGDTASLRSATGATIDSCRWTSNGPGYKNC